MRPLRTLPNGGPARFSLILMRFSRRAQLLGLAKRHAIFTNFDRREYAETGGCEADLQPKDRPPISPILTCLSETNSFVIGH